MGGLFTLEDISLLTTVFAKVEPVLLARNLNNYTVISKGGSAYSQEQVVIKICALCVSLVLILDSSSLNQVNAL
jgi:hypothetical protein